MRAIVAADYQIGISVAVQVIRCKLLPLDWQVNVALRLEAQLALIEEPREALGTVPLALTEKGQVAYPSPLKSPAAVARQSGAGMICWRRSLQPSGEP